MLNRTRHEGTWPNPRSDPDRIAQRPKGYRLAWYRSNPQSPNACGRAFRTVEAAQKAAPEFNKGRIARRQQPCHCILECKTRAQ
jgi:hypothetical protein